MTEWEPATEAEAAMRDALRANDQELYFRILARTDLLLPVSAEALAGQAPMGWGTWTTGGRTHVLAFTSEAALRACLGDNGGSSRRSAYHDLAAGWPNHEWWLAVNPGLPIEGYLPAWFVSQLSRGDVRLPGRTLGARARLERAEQVARTRTGGPEAAPPPEPAPPPRVPPSNPPPNPPPYGANRPPVVTPPRRTVPDRSAEPTEAFRFPPADAARPAPEPPPAPGGDPTEPASGWLTNPRRQARPDPVPPSNGQSAGPGGRNSFFEPAPPGRGAGPAPVSPLRAQERAVPPSRLGEPGRAFPRRRPYQPGDEPTRAFQFPEQTTGEPAPPPAAGNRFAAPGPAADRTQALPRRQPPPDPAGAEPTQALPRRVPPQPAAAEPTQPLPRRRPAVADDPVGQEPTQPIPPAPGPAAHPAAEPTLLVGPTPATAPSGYPDSGRVGGPSSYVDPVPTPDPPTYADSAQATVPPGYADSAQVPVPPGYPGSGRVAGSSGYPAAPVAESSGYTPAQAADPSGYPAAPVTDPPGYAAAPVTDPSGYPDVASLAEPAPVPAETRRPPSPIVIEGTVVESRDLTAPESTHPPEADAGPGHLTDPVAEPAYPSAPIPEAAYPGDGGPPYLTDPAYPSDPAPAATYPGNGGPAYPSDPEPAPAYPAEPGGAYSASAEPGVAYSAEPGVAYPVANGGGGSVGGDPVPAVVPGPESTGPLAATEPATVDFRPANDVEEDLLAAAGTGSTDTFLSTLLLARVLLPVAPESAPGASPGETGFVWRTEQLDGETYVVVYTSPERLADHAIVSVETVRVKFVQLIRRWPDPQWSFAVNPGTPVGAKLPGEQIVALANWAAEVGLGDDAEPEPVSEPAVAEEPANPTRYATTQEDPNRPPMMQKAVAPSQLAYYLERGYDRVSGFVHRAGEVAHLNTPARLYGALGLGYPDSPFSPDADEVYVLRWPAYRPSLYRIPYGGQHESAMRAMEGWVIERPPFRGNGFAPGESSDVVAEFKVDSARLPHGAQLWRIGADGSERVVAVLDADALLWRQVGER